MVYCGIYPADGARYGDLRDALDKLQLNDASLTFEPETSVALGFGFRCGFLGLLHLEIIIERLEREFDLDLITTAPSVEYRLTMTDGEVVMIDNPTNYPDPSKIANSEEPFVEALSTHLRNLWVILWSFVRKDEEYLKIWPTLTKPVLICNTTCLWAK